MSSAVLWIKLPFVMLMGWGKIKIGSVSYKDVRIWPDHVEEWDWNKHGTQHVPGIQIADVSDFIDKVDVIVLSQGVDGVLQIMPETIDYIKKAGKELHIARTPQAINIYHDLVQQGKNVGALFHSTC